MLVSQCSEGSGLVGDIPTCQNPPTDCSGLLWWGWGLPCVFITVTVRGSDQNGLVGSYTPYMTTKEQIRTKSEQNVRKKSFGLSGGNVTTGGQSVVSRRV